MKPCIIQCPGASWMHWAGVPHLPNFQCTIKQQPTVFFGNSASGYISGSAFHLGNGTIRLRLRVCRL